MPPARPKKKKKRGAPWKIIPRGSVIVKIYATQGKRAPYTIAWRATADGHRERAMRSDPFAAVSHAEQIATDLANGEAWRSLVGQADWASYKRALDILAHLRPNSLSAIGGEEQGEVAQFRPVPLELAISDYVTNLKKLPTGVTLSDAIKGYLEHQPRGVTAQNIPALVNTLIEKKRLHGKGEKWLGTLSQQLGRFAESFTCPIHALRAHEINAWLDSLKTGLRTRKNYRDAIRELVRFAQAEGQLSKTWDELERVQDPEPPPVEVEIYTPAQIIKLLSATRPNMIAFTILQAFAGVRHEEMTGKKALLDWRDIDLAKGVIKIKKTVGKTKKLRLIELHPSTIAWLIPHSRPSGRVCELDHTANAIVRAKRRAGLPAGRGLLTNALRSSFISYRLAETNDIGLVSREAGNSPDIIRSNYLELVSKAEATRWFEIWPTKSEILQLNFSGI
jgi:integrase